MRNGGRDEPQAIDALARRHRELETRRIQAEAELEHVEKALEEQRARARERFGTADLGELRAKLEWMREENVRRRREYQVHLDEIERGLAAIELADPAAERPSAAPAA